MFTTNAGVQENRVGQRRVGFDRDDISYEENKEAILATIKKIFNPEFLNRVDHFIFFNRLTESCLKRVAKLELKHLPIKKLPSLLNYIVNNSNHEEYGARNIAKFIKNNISTQVADAILKKQVPVGNAKYYTFKIEQDNLYISNIEEEDDGWKNEKTTESS